ncbi:MAG: hypothetical protein ABSA77_07100 [Thermoguttaceae bacterium]|jgi:hypothetical protein
MLISDLIITAYDNLLRVIPESLSAEAESKGARLPDINPTALHDVTRRFVDALCKEPATAAELKRRGTLVTTLTAEGSEYLAAKKKARVSLQQWNPNEPILQRLVNHFQSEGGRELVGDVRHEYERLTHLLDGFSVPDTTRPLLEAWRDAAWSIVSEGENNSLDGCYWLLHIDKLRHSIFAIPAAPDIRQAAKAMVAWCRKHAAVQRQHIAQSAAMIDVATERLQPSDTPPNDQGNRGNEKNQSKKRIQGKWYHVWQIIQNKNATKGNGQDQAIANDHNRDCAIRIKDGTCERINARKVAQIRYEYTHPGRHRKQNHKT